MNSCPFCHSDLEEKSTICPSCNAKKSYLKVIDYVPDKNTFTFFGLTIPFLIFLIAICGQNLFGVYVSIVMAILMLYVVGRLIIGAKWIK